MNVPARTRIEPRPSGARRTWYLILRIGLPVRCSGEDPARHLRIVQKELRPLSTVVRRMDVGSEVNSIGHYLLRFQRYSRDDIAATRLAEAFLYGMSLLHGPMIEDDPGSLILRVPDSMVNGATAIQPETLIELERSRPPEERDLDYPYSAVGGISATTADRHEVAWRIAAVTFDNETLFDATRFLKRSHDNFYVYPGQIREVACDRQASPPSSSHQTHFEDALHNAFKAIEAVIGDPPKDDRKFFDKIKAIGIDPAEPVGYDERLPISTVIRTMNEARDKRSAHGSTGRRTIRPAELLDFQACADVIVLAAIERARGSSVFDGVGSA